MGGCSDHEAPTSPGLVIRITTIHKNYLGKLSNLGNLGPEGSCIIKIEEDKYADFLILQSQGVVKRFHLKLINLIKR